MNGSNELGRYRTVTVFSDVKPSYWAAPYINMAAKGKNIIAGYADGLFHPDRTVTVGQAVTILLRMLGYKDEDVGGVWPDSYMAEAATIGLDRRRGHRRQRRPHPGPGGAAVPSDDRREGFMILEKEDWEEPECCFRHIQQPQRRCIQGARTEVPQSGR